MRYFPYGVSVHILPFNFPIILMAFTVAASLAAGNAVIIKPAEATSLCTLRFMEHFRALPSGLVACVTGGAPTAQALVRSSGTHAVAFTGSVEAGRQVAAACAEQMKPCVIEAGGNDPMIVMDSAPVEVAAAAAATAAFHLSGQICTSAERFFVHERVHDAFVEFAGGDGAAAAHRQRHGPGGDRPAGQRGGAEQGDGAGGRRGEAGGEDRLRRPRAAVLQHRLVLRADGADGRHAGHGRSCSRKCFGPVAPVCRVRSLDEAIRLANNSRFGLGATIYTTDTAEAMEATERLEAGMVWVNNVLGDNDALPFGGWKLSGLGRALGRPGLNAFRQTKMVMFDPKPALQDWWYPYSDAFFAEREKV